MAYILNKVSILHRTIFHNNIIFGSNLKITCVKNYKHLTNRTNIKAEQRFKFQDNISDDYKLIYREQRTIGMTAITTYNAGWIGLFTAGLVTSYLVINNPLIQKEDPPIQKEDPPIQKEDPPIQKEDPPIQKEDIPIQKEDPPMQKNEDKHNTFKPLTKMDRVLLLIGGSIACILLIVVSKTIPLRIYYNPKQKLYKAIFASNILGKKNILTFSEGTVKSKFKNFMVDSLYHINGYTVLLDSECFPVPHVREKMLYKNN